MITREEKLELAQAAHRRYMVTFEWKDDDRLLNWFKGFSGIEEKIIYPMSKDAWLLHQVFLDDKLLAQHLVVSLHGVRARNVKLLSCVTSSTHWTDVEQA